MRARSIKQVAKGDDARVRPQVRVGITPDRYRSWQVTSIDHLLTRNKQVTYTDGEVITGGY